MSPPTGNGDPGKRAREQSLTSAEVAMLLGVSKMTVYRLIHDQELRAHRIGRYYRVEPADLTEYLGADCLAGSDSLLTWVDPNWVDPRPDSKW
jgi:excisionase family DNA binding protein